MRNMAVLLCLLFIVIVSSGCTAPEVSGPIYPVKAGLFTVDELLNQKQEFLNYIVSVVGAFEFEDVTCRDSVCRFDSVKEFCDSGGIQKRNDCLAAGKSADQCTSESRDFYAVCVDDDESQTHCTLGEIKTCSYCSGKLMLTSQTQKLELRHEPVISLTGERGIDPHLNWKTVKVHVCQGDVTEQSNPTGLEEGVVYKVTGRFKQSVIGQESEDNFFYVLEVIDVEKQ